MSDQSGKTYELRVSGAPLAYFATEPDAVAAAKRILADQPFAEVEVLDARTGRAAAPGSSQNSREHLAKEVGF